MNSRKIENTFLRKVHEKEILLSKVKMNLQVALDSNIFPFYLERRKGISSLVSRQFICRLIHACSRSPNIVTPTMRWQKGRNLAAERLEQLPTAIVKVDAPEKLGNVSVTGDLRACITTLRETLKQIIRSKVIMIDKLWAQPIAKTI